MANCQISSNTHQAAFFYCLLFLTSALAAPPKFVYRSDFRPPDDIFRNGFKALGKDDNLNNHVTGASCYTGARDTAFVATTSSWQFAVDWGRDRSVINTDKMYIYVYTIRATGNYYNAYESLLEAYRKTGDTNYQALASKYQYQAEWLAYNGVIYSEVQKVDIYGRPDASGNMPHIRTETNRDYIDAPTEGNPSPYPVAGRSPTTHWLLPSSLWAFTACFGLCRRNSFNSYIEATYGKTYPKP